MRRLVVTVPDRVYYALLVTWAAIIFGVAVGVSHYYLSTPTNLLTLSPPRMEVLAAENMTLHNRIYELEQELVKSSRSDQSYSSKR